MQLEDFGPKVANSVYQFFQNPQNIAMFKEKGIELEPFIVPGGHTWMNCKLFLANSLQQLFK